MTEPFVMEPVQALLLVLVAVASLCPAIAVEVQVLPDLASDCSSPSDNNGGAVNIDTALMNTRSNTTLLLVNGCYLINNFTLLQDLSNISLIGSGSETTIVKCQSDGEVGLAFVNISGLRLSDVTISNCSLSGMNYLQKAFSLLQQSLNVPRVFLFILPTIVGIFIGDTSDLQARNVTVCNTPGFGMVAINLIGTSDISNVTFINNHGGPNHGLFFFGGGGLYILYADYHNYTPTVMPKLTVSASSFKWNSNDFGSGGGLSITLSQTKFPVDINVASTLFENNTSPQGGGAVIVYHQGVNGSSVNISGSIFRKNVVRGGGERGGGGLAVVLNNNFPQINQDVFPDQILSNTIIVENTTIEENQARLFAGASISYSSQQTTNSNQNRVIFKSCRFLKNRSSTGAAFGAAFEAQSFVFNSEVNIIFDSVIVKENNASFFTEESLRAGSPEEASVVVLSSVNLIVRGKSQFLMNVGSALKLTRSTVTIDGDVSFVANKGSGIRLLDSSLIVLQKNSKLSFIKNRANSKGGAIFVDLYSSIVGSSLTNDCFLRFEGAYSCTNFENCIEYVSQLNVSLVFENNQAPVGGTIYGSRLNSCSWAKYANRTKPSSGILFLEQFPSVTFKPSRFDSSVVSTDVSNFFTNITQLISAVPGKPVEIIITALDLFDQTVPTFIRSDYQTASRLQFGSSTYWYLNPDRAVSVTFYGKPGNMPSSFTISVVDSYARVNLSVTFENCPYGFFLNGNLKCECDPNLPPSVSDITCDQQSFQQNIPTNMWLGESPTGGFAYTSCILDYCKVGNKTITDSNNDSQCQPGYNRSGLLCASCVSNTSVVFGSNACRTCSNAWLAFIIVFAVLGIVLVLAISFLGFSISEGYLNSLLFYCNVTSFYSSFFAPNISIEYGFILVKFIDLSLGFELCFYNGMVTLAKVGIQLLFPAYLFLIMIVIIILAKYSSKISNAGFSAAKTFSTLLLLCYTSVGETCIQIVAWKAINGTNGTYYGWYTDPNIPYGQVVFHGFLIFVALALILFYILPFSIALLLPPLILRTRFNIMLKPLLDAFWNPFKPKFRFWLGFRAILRIIPFFFAVLISPPYNSFWLIIFLAALLLFHGFFQPFEGKWQNFFDEFFLLNLLLLAVGTVFFRSASPNSPTPLNGCAHIAFVSILLVLAYLVFLIIVALHINIHFPVIRNTAIKHYYWLKQRLNKKQKCNDTEDDNNDPVIHKSAQPKMPMTTFSELREPFLEYGEGDFL